MKLLTVILCLIILSCSKVKQQNNKGIYYKKDGIYFEHPDFRDCTGTGILLFPLLPIKDSNITYLYNIHVENFKPVTYEKR